MFFGNIKNLEKHFDSCDEAIKKALIYLRDHDFKTMADGKYEIDGDKIYAKLQRYMTRPVEECHPEAHRRYVDVQFMVDGREELGWCAFSPDLRQRVSYDNRDDVEFFEQLVPESSIVLNPGDFAVLYPSDVHRPQVAIDSISKAVTKVVVKVAVDLCKDK